MLKSNKPEIRDIVSMISPIGDQETCLTALFYGRSGTGKTTVSATFPKPMLLIDVKEKGTQSVRQVPGIESVSIEHWGEFEALYYHLLKAGKKYKTVVLDPTSGLQRLAMSKVREDIGKKDGDLLSRKDWGSISGMMSTWLGHYRDLVARGKFIVFTAHERTNGGEDVPEDQIDPTIGPQLMPSVASFLCGAVDIVAHTSIRERIIKKDGQKIRKVDYCLRIGPHAYYTTKIRTPREFTPPDIVTDPNYEKIVKLVNGVSIVKLKEKSK